MFSSRLVVDILLLTVAIGCYQSIGAYQSFLFNLTTTSTMDPALDPNVDLDIQEILLAATNHDIPKLRHLIRVHQAVANPANVKDPETGVTPLHAAIGACKEDEGEDGKKDGQVNGEPATNGVHPEEDTRDPIVQGAIDTVKFLLGEGAIWNDLDANDETPGCLARRLGVRELYEMMVDAGVRAEMLLNRLDGYEPLENDEDEDEGEDTAAPEQAEESTTTAAEGTTTTESSVTNPEYLTSNLTIEPNRILDADQNGVMMSWERDIMRKSADKLLPREGLKVLNIGHGMGIVDEAIQSHSPSEHHIIEAHPEVLREMKRKGWDTKPGIRIHEGRWQDVLPRLVGEGVQFDAMYYDTFAEDYSDFRDFFSEHVIGLLEQDGRWGYFNGMGADRQISYDVYQKVVEMDLFEAGFDVDWEEIAVPKLEGEWEGVRRPYWVVENYRLPVCRYMD